MQTTSAVYRRILSETNHWFETCVVIGESGALITEQNDRILFGGDAIVVSRTGPDSGYQEYQIFSLSTTSNLFDNEPTVGVAAAAEIQLSMINPAGDMPRMSVVIPYVRAHSMTEASEWLQQGEFYIDSREISHNNDGLDILTIHGYDAMLRAEQDYASTKLDWPALDTDIVAEIAEQMGVTVDERSYQIMTDGNRLPLPTGYSLREYLSYIGSMYVGGFVMTDLGQLRLISLLDLPKESNYLTDGAGYSLLFGNTRILV